VLASSKIAQRSSTELGHLVAGYKLCARSEGKSKNTIDIVTNSVGYFEGFLRSEGLPTYVTQISVKMDNLWLDEGLLKVMGKG